MNIQETTFGPKKYLTIKKSIPTDKITDKQMYDEAGKKLGEYMQANSITPSGSWSVLYFTWDETNAKTDIGIAFPVEGVNSVTNDEFSIVEVPQSQAAMAVLEGSYEGLGKTHQALMEYVSKLPAEAKNVPVMAVEEYLVGPMDNESPEKWVTNIYYLHT